MNVLYDGWDLAYQPNSPAAFHLLTLLAARPAGVQAFVGLPDQSFHSFAEDVRVIAIPVSNTSSGRLAWEQRRLPGLAQECRADLLHSFGRAALFQNCAAVISPADLGWVLESDGMAREHFTLADRLGEALGAGGLARLKAHFWPGDLARVASGLRETARRFLLPPVVHPAFISSISPNGRSFAELDLPENFILYQGNGLRESLQRLLAAWSWAAASIGAEYPLVAVGMSRAKCSLMDQIAREYRLDDTVRCLPPLPLPVLASVYRACRAVFHPEEATAWGGALRQGLVCGKPLVGMETRISDAILGDAGYLVRGGGSEAEQIRALGAALITVIVNDEVTQNLGKAAEERSARYRLQDFSTALGEAYQALGT